MHYSAITKEQDFMASPTTLYHQIDLIFHKVGKALKQSYGKFENYIYTNI